MPDNQVGNVIGMAAPLAGSILGAINTATLNKKSLDFAKTQFYTQREWALQDWEMQNEYNLPVNQRQRMIDAGINPALMYGKGPGDMTSGAVRSTPTTSWNPKTIDYPGMAQNSLMAYMGIRKQNAELEQMELQNDLLRQRIAGQGFTNQLTIDKTRLTSAQASKLENWLSELKKVDDAHQSMNYFGTDLGVQGANIVNEQLSKQGKSITDLGENARREIYTANNTSELVEKLTLLRLQQSKTSAETDNIKQNYELLMKSNILKQFQIDGQQFLNSRFDGALGAAMKVLLGLLTRADIIR